MQTYISSEITNNKMLRLDTGVDLAIVSRMTHMGTRTISVLISELTVISGV